MQQEAQLASSFERTPIMKRNLILAVLAVAPLALMAQPPTRDFTALKTYLGLTDAQVTSLTGVTQSERQASRGIATEAHTNRQAFEAASRSGTADAATLGNLMLAVQASDKKMQSLRAQYQSQAVGVLTADQQAKLKVLSDAAALMPHIHEATMLNLLTPAQGAGFERMGRGGPGRPGMPPPAAAQNQ
jgi:Spy/CpxP family protein refolding chaperone